MKQIILILYVLILATGLAFSQGELLTADKGLIQLTSNAPLELIECESKGLRGVIDPEKKSFAFSVSISSFHGFNSEIQRTHFMENYMEQKIYPHATFTGKIIEDIPFDTPGTYSVRAKGDLEIHGMKKERIIKGTITITNNSVQIQTNFNVPLVDHGIAIPKIVRQKIADLIAVSVDMTFVSGSGS